MCSNGRHSRRSGLKPVFRIKALILKVPLSLVSTQNNSYRVFLPLHRWPTLLHLKAYKSRCILFTQILKELSVSETFRFLFLVSMRWCCYPQPHLLSVWPPDKIRWSGGTEGMEEVCFLVYFQSKLE